MLTDPKKSRPFHETVGRDKRVPLAPIYKALDKYLEKETLLYSIDGMQSLVDLNFLFGRLYHMGVLHTGDREAFNRVGENLGKRQEVMGTGYKVEGMQISPSVDHGTMSTFTKELHSDLKTMIGFGKMLEIEVKVLRQIIDNYLVVAMQFYEGRNPEIEKDYPPLGVHKAFLAALAVKHSHAFPEAAVSLANKLLRAVHGAQAKKTVLTIYRAVKRLHNELKPATKKAA